MAQFDWDPNKERRNVEKHGIDFLTALELWSGDYLELETRPGNDASRNLVIGEIGGWIWTAVVTHRGDTIRIISVRRARDYEREALHEYRKRRHGDGCDGGGD